MIRPLKLFLIAGEPSGDRLGAELIDGLREIVGTDLQVAGVGGGRMQESGLQSLFPMNELSLMGIAEILTRIPSLYKRISQTVEAIAAMQPDALITIDSPDFNFRVAARAKRQNRSLRVIHYVAPTVWAWRPGRARHMATFTEHVMVLLPFEPHYFRVAGMTCDFVGHPAICRYGDDEVNSARERLKGRLAGHPLVAILPGSRASELRRMGPVFKGVVQEIANRHSDTTFVLPAATAVADMVEELVADWKGRVVVIDPSGKDTATAELEKFAAMTLADAAFATSGTVALELAAANCPMVIGYKSNWLTGTIVKRMARVSSVNLVNLVNGSNDVPEFLLDDCRPDKIATALSGLLIDEKQRSRQLAAFARAMSLMEKDRFDPARRAAESVLRVLH